MFCSAPLSSNTAAKTRTSYSMSAFTLLCEPRVDSLALFSMMLSRCFCRCEVWCGRTGIHLSPSGISPSPRGFCRCVRPRCGNYSILHGVTLPVSIRRYQSCVRAEIVRCCERQLLGRLSRAKAVRAEREFVLRVTVYVRSNICNPESVFVLTDR